MNTAPHRLAALCHDLGVISDELYQAVLKQTGAKSDAGQKSLVQIMTSQVSARTLKELATYEIKFGAGRPRENNSGAPAEPVFELKEHEILEILLRNQPELAQLDQLLTDNDPRYTEELAERPPLAEGEDSAAWHRVVYERLVNHKTLSQERLNEIADGRNFPQYEANRLSLISRIFELNKIVTAAQFDQALNDALHNGTFLSTALEQRGILTEKELRDVLVKPLELPWVGMDRLKLKKKVLNRLPDSLYHREIFLVFEADEENMKLAVPDPLNFELADVLSILTGKTVQLFFADGERIVKTIGKSLGAQPATEEEEDTMPERKKDAAVRADASVSKKELQSQSTVADSQTTVQLVKQILDKAVEAKATDIHLESQPNALRVRYRIDGMLHKIMEAPKNMMLPVISRLKVLGDMDVTERRRPQDGHFNLIYDGSKYDFRVSSIPTNLGEKLVIRALREQSAVSQLTDLGMDDAQQEIMRKLVLRTFGCILATGPTGSGKTTTLYTALNMLNTEDRNLVTIEDPIEYEIPGINQIQVDVKANVTFANGLRATLRQDPDVIMVGEIRDAETAQVATRAALTGHLVFSTLHTNTTVGAITTLIHMGVPPLLISSALAGIISQRLVRRICKECKEPLTPTAAMLDDLGMAPNDPMPMYHGKGCDKCWKTGYSGRDGIYEILLVDDDMRNLINANSNEMTMLEYAIAAGMQTLKKSAMNKMAAGITTPDEILKTVFMNN